MKKKKEKWYIYSKLKKGEIVNMYENLKISNKQLQSEFDLLHEENNVLNSKLKECLKDIEELKNKVKEEEGYALRSKVHLLEKLVALHEKTPKDTIRYVNNGVNTSTNNTSPWSTSSLTTTI
jgi:predicted nuclease with TOPRIM domain